MKKKILLSILFLFVFSVCLIKVNAANTQYPPLFNPGFDTEAKAPSTIPANNSIVFTTLTEPFDFSKVKFAKSGGGTVDGKSELKKIIIGTLASGVITKNTDANKTLDQLFTNWFTAYCLDANKKYPDFGLFSSGGYYNDSANLAVGYSQAVDSTGHYQENGDVGRTALNAAIALAMIMNNDDYADVVDALIDYIGDPMDVMLKYNDLDQMMAAEMMVLTDTATDQDFYDYFMGNSNTPAQMGFGYLGFTSASDPTKLFFIVANGNQADNVKGIYGNDVEIEYLLGSPYTDDYYPMNISLGDLAFEKYQAKDTKDITNYAHALWIVENSYPTLTLNTSLTRAGVDIDTLKTQVKGLYNISDGEVNDYTEMVVYGTVQYAIWKVTGIKVDGVNLGTEVNNSTELDKLYKYLINAEVPANYVNPSVYTNTLKVNKPADGKELFKTTDSGYYYGPYSVTYNALVDSSEKISYTITNTEATGIKVVNESLTEVSNLEKGQQFYFFVDKRSNVGTITANFSLRNVTTFEPSTNRGRVYYPLAALGQNALSGGKTGLRNISGNVSVATNPKTGVQNIALLLMVTLVAFSLGYFVLSSKQKQIGLN